MDARQDDLPRRLIAAHADTRECYDLAKGWLVRVGCGCGISRPYMITGALHQDPWLGLPYARRCAIANPIDTYPPSTRPAIAYSDHQRHEGKVRRSFLCVGLWIHRFQYHSGQLRFRQEEGIWPLDLPKTLRDSVDITRRLEYEFLWVDALCILQRDFEDWSHESVRMASVYGNAKSQYLRTRRKKLMMGFY